MEFNSLQQPVDGVGQLAVAFGHHMPGVMGVQLNPDVAEFVVEDGVMPLLLGEEGHPRHEGEGFLKVLEPELTHESVVLFHPHGAMLWEVNVAPSRGN